MWAVLLALLLSGCATSGPATGSDRETRAKLFRTQVGDEVTLQWQSQPGIVYGVIYSTDIKDNRNWHLLPGFDRIVGNGGSQRITFTAPVAGKAYYRLRESRAR
jgi:hypothetical protein